MASAKERVRDCGEVGGPQTENVTRVNNQQVCGLVLQFVYICGLKKRVFMGTFISQNKETCVSCVCKQRWRKLSCYVNEQKCVCVCGQ